jgi:hypothetical protein
MASFQGVEHPEDRLNNPAILQWIERKGWIVCPPSCQWNYWHAIVNGGIIPFSYAGLIYAQRKDP